MDNWHIVQQGEHLMGIAAASGFASIDPVWDHPENADLRARRSPELLLPGDRIFVPDLTLESISCSTGQRHRVVVRRMSLSLGVRLLDALGVPLSDLPVEVAVDGQTTQRTTDAEGRLTLPISALARSGVLTYGDRKLSFRVGALDPSDEPSGCHGRLMNLGYFDGPLDEPDTHELRAAIEEFQCDQSLALTGELDAAMQAKLLEVHGC